jgi:hypothetical protein
MCMAGERYADDGLWTQKVSLNKNKAWVVSDNVGYTRHHVKFIWLRILYMASYRVRFNSFTFFIIIIEYIFMQKTYTNGTSEFIIGMGTIWIPQS